MKTLSALLIYFSLTSPLVTRSQESRNQQAVRTMMPVVAKYLLDTTITTPAHLYPIDKPQKIVYHLLVIDWDKPVEYSLAVMVGNDTIKYHGPFKSDWFEYWIDSAKSMEEIISLQNDKKEYFLTDMGGGGLSFLYPDDPDIEFYKKACRHVFNMDFPSQGFSKDEIESLYNKFWKYYEGKTINCVTYPGDGPNGGSGPYAYHPDLKKLVRIYTP